MSEINEINKIIIPETPKMISNEQIFVYIPERLIPDKIRWGTIIGNLSDQDDLKNALLDIDTKVTTNTSKIGTLTVDVNNNTSDIRTLQTGLSNKLDKSDTGNALYGTYNNQGTIMQKMYNFHELAEPSTIPLRDFNGDLIVKQTPVSDNGATSKKYVDDIQSNLELSTVKEIILSAEGVGENNVYNFTVENVNTYLPYRTNGTKFLLDLNLPLVGSLVLDNKVTITFGDTVYYLYNILKGNEHVTIRDLKQVDKYNNATGYRFIFHATFFQNADITGFAVIPTISMSDILSLTSDEMNTYMTDGGLTEGQIAICNSVGTAGGYTEGHLYKFEITYPSTYSWKELSQSGSGGVTQSDIQNMLVSSLTNTETWILPQNLPMKADDGLKTRTWDVNFTSNNIKFTQFRINDYYADGRSVYYNDTRVFYIDNAPTPIQYIWTNDAYRTIIFDEPVTGTLRTWLINHDAVKQSDSGTPNKATGEIGTIKKHSDGLEFYPKTFIECVYSEDGKTLDTLMPSANPTTTTETPDLTSMTINGIAYKIVGGGSGGASANYNYYWGE